MKRPVLIPLLALLLVGGALGTYRVLRHPAPAAHGTAEARVRAILANPKAKAEAEPLLALLREVLGDYRRIIVLFADESSQGADEKVHVSRIGLALYYRNHERLDLLDRALVDLATGSRAGRHRVVEELLDWIEAGPELFDADRLAFRECLKTLQRSVGQDQTLVAARLGKRISEDLTALTEIEGLYDKELKQVFGRFDTRAIAVQRQRWDDYVTRLRALFTREQVLRDHGAILPYPQKGGPDEGREVTGRSLPAKTLLLSFDDGPHGTYTEEIAAILRQYGVPGVFFELGQNLGTVEADGTVKLGKLAGQSRRLLEAGHVLANHSFSHGQMAKMDEAAVRQEVERTDALLRAVDGSRPGSRLFRFPYGAGSDTALKVLEGHGLKSMFWNIDSRDWADPVPNAIADRVLKAIEAEQRGVVLFHDIHERTVKALPVILDRLIAEGYRFATWENGAFKVGEAAVSPSKAAPTTGYRESWAVVVGIDDYARWPKLQHAVRDAEALRETLVTKFGFAADHVITLKNQEATRAAILGTLNGKLASLQRDDRVLVFFAGHGATKKLSSGRDLGYLVPVDSDPATLATDGIPMTELQNLAEAFPAKHVLFLMDACYSGLGLTRGGGNEHFLRENARRLGRQMLTAGGADQLVADGGPGGHSIFTWTLLQGLNGKADLNGDGFITGTELAAYVSPAVSELSSQTPAFGSLPGSEGGEFVFELPAESEALSGTAPQLDARALAMAQKVQAKLDTLKLQAPVHVNPGGPSVQVTVKGLDGGQTRLNAGKAVPLAPRQAAQRAHDRGLLAFREARYAEAEALFAEALKLRPDFALAANNLGFAYFKQGRHPEAARWFEQALKLDPGRAIAHFNLGETRALMGDREGARAALNTYLGVAPNGVAAARAKELLKGL